MAQRRFLYAILGDSISTLQGYNPEGFNVYYKEEICNSSGVNADTDTWWGKVIDAHGGSLLVNNAWSGSRVTAMPQGNGLFPSGCSDERTSQLHKGDIMPDVIIVFLGFNDWSNGVDIGSDGTRLLAPIHFNAFDEAYEAMVGKLRTNYPNAELWCCTLPQTYIASKPQFVFPEAFAGIHIEKYNDVIRNLSDEYPIKVIDLYRSGCKYDSMDGIHPTKHGMQQIADTIIELTSGTEMLYSPETESLQEPETATLYNSGEANTAVLEDTLQVFSNGVYQRDGKTVKCASLKQLSQAKVYLPDDIASLQKTTRKQSPFIHNCSIICENTDSFSAAVKLSSLTGQYYHVRKDPMEILVLNFANPFNPGGGVRRGANAQEEDLCRKSSLLLSLESDSAKAYYNYHRQLRSPYSSDAIILSPKVQIIKDTNQNLLPSPVTVAVLTCAAPMLQNGLQNLTQEQYHSLMARRIDGILSVAAHLGYRVLVLGAFGCGAFGNDPNIVSELFRSSLEHYCLPPFGISRDFQIIDFAVLDNSEQKRNIKAFSAAFS